MFNSRATKYSKYRGYNDSRYFYSFFTIIFTMSNFIISSWASFLVEQIWRLKRSWRFVCSSRFYLEKMVTRLRYNLLQTKYYLP